MIIGIGTDLCDIRRIEKALERFGDRFIQRSFTEAEQRRCDARPHPASGYAQRFAAKEACSKALGTGFRQGVFMRDMGMEHEPSGKPHLILTGGALKRLQVLLPHGMEGRVDVSTTDEYPYAQAFVVISAVALTTQS